jgi:hypothetical protein
LGGLDERIDDAKRIALLDPMIEVYKFRLDLTGFVNRGWAVRLHEAVGSHAACINFSFATGSVSMKVAISVLP